jgi:outer membrane lipoprotein-sorting protein
MSKNSAGRGVRFLAFAAVASLPLALSGCGAASALATGLSQTASAAGTTVMKTATAAGASVGLASSGPVTNRGGLNRYNPYTGQWNN